MLEVSRVGVAESDDEIELSLELSIGGRYGKCEKPRKPMMQESSSLSRENNNERVVVVENGVIPFPRAGFTFPEDSVIGVGGEFQVEAGIGSAAIGSVDPETVEQIRKREIHALRRLEARRKREERMRKSAMGFRGIAINGNSINYFDRVGFEAQKLQERVEDRKNREEESLLDDDEKVHRKKGTLKVINFAVKSDETAVQNHGKMKFVSQCGPLKNGFLYHSYGAPPGVVAGGVRKEENEMKEPVAYGNFRPYVNGNGSKLEIVRQNSEWSSSAVSDYRSTSGKGGSTSDTGSHSSCLQASDQQLSIAATNDTQAEVNAKSLVSRESGCGEGDITAAIRKVKIEPDAFTSNEVNPTSSPLNQCGGSSDNPSNHHQQQNIGNRMRSLPQMPCVSTTGNGPNGKTVNGILYRYTKNEVSIVCVCHGSSFSPAEFVEHAGGTDITNPLRHITMVAAPVV